MRPRDVRIPLHDMRVAADAIGSFIDGRTYEEYASDLMFRSAVQRQFEILGEAMCRALRIESGLAGHLDEARGVVDFRNVIVLGYDTLSHHTVWDLATAHLPRLRKAVGEGARPPRGGHLNRHLPRHAILPVCTFMCTRGQSLRARVRLGRSV